MKFCCVYHPRPGLCGILSSYKRLPWIITIHPKQISQVATFDQLCECLRVYLRMPLRPHPRACVRVCVCVCVNRQLIRTEFNPLFSYPELVKFNLATSHNEAIAGMLIVVFGAATRTRTSEQVDGQTGRLPDQLILSPASS